MRPRLHLIQLPDNTPVFERLQLEEALLRSDERSFCVMNFGSPRAIVMGVSGEAALLLNLSKVEREKLLVIKRFSGGGTVIVDENTLFVTFILAKKDLEISSFPEPILRWSSDLYVSAWGIPDFHLRENDYCIGDKKCGGNAQYIRKNRWMHHTSFLWDYEPENMDALLLPPKRPAYRLDRPHEEFLCRLKTYGANPETRIDQLREELVKQFYIEEFDLAEYQSKPHRQSTHIIAL